MVIFAWPGGRVAGRRLRDHVCWRDRETIIFVGLGGPTKRTKRATGTRPNGKGDRGRAGSSGQTSKRDRGWPYFGGFLPVTPQKTSRVMLSRRSSLWISHDSKPCW